MAIKNVAIAGATGTIGQPILQALLDANHFNVTVLTRSNSTRKNVLPSNVKTAIVDYADPDSLVAALKGQDAVISALTSTSTPAQEALLEAIVRTGGVARYIPSEFGSDTLNAHTAKLPVFAGSKKKIQAQVEDLAAQGKLTYTYVITGPFLDFGLDDGFLGLDLKKKQFTYYDGGNVKFSATTCGTIGKAVVGILVKAEETKNRAVYVQDVAISSRELLRLAKRVVGEDVWTEIDAGSSADSEKASYEKLGRGQMDRGVFFGFLVSAISREGYGGRFQKLDNELFGIPQMSETEVVEVIREVAKGHQAA